jgi:DNA-binding NarL/FixJ family response regulator
MKHSAEVSPTQSAVFARSLASLDGHGTLTGRERDVVYRLASGITDRQIAAQLGLSPRTVHKHLEHVYQKLGVSTRTAAVMRIVDRLIEQRR